MEVFFVRNKPLINMWNGMKFSPPILFEVAFFLKAQFTKKGWEGGEKREFIANSPSFYPS